jgi:hypothetical protein
LRSSMVVKAFHTRRSSSGSACDGDHLVAASAERPRVHSRLHRPGFGAVCRSGRGSHRFISRALAQLSGVRSGGSGTWPAGDPRGHCSSISCRSDQPEADQEESLHYAQQMCRQCKAGQSEPWNRQANEKSE